MYILGLDVGGTKTEAALLRVGARAGAPGLALPLHGTKTVKLAILARKRIPTARRAGFSTILAQLAKLCAEVIAHGRIDAKELTGMGIGLPGSVDPPSGKMLSGNTMADRKS